MDAYFQGKRALVTGAGKGIGRAIAVKLASLGAIVIGVSRTKADLDSLKVEVPSLEICVLDIAEWDNTKKTIEELGHIDLLVNNAGVTGNIPFFDVTKEALDSNHDVHFRAAFNITQVIAKSMVAKGTGGAVVNISSALGVRCGPIFSAYSTSKAALDMLTQTLAVELGPSKIRVNSVNPTLTMTDMAKKQLSENPEILEGTISRTPLRKVADVEDIVNAAVFLLSDKAAMITGVIMPVDGGLLVGCL